MDRRRAVFLDRDGVLNEKAPEGDYVKNWKEFRFLPDVPEALATLKRLGFLLVVVTNQRCVARGIVSEETIDGIHRLMAAELRTHGTDLDGIYYCPHDVPDGCSCRKPKPGLILSAIDAFERMGMELDLPHSFMIGDSETDVIAGKAVGMKTAFIGRSHVGVDLCGHSLGYIARQLAGLRKVKERCCMKSMRIGLSPGADRGSR
jgi:histidinol-phosphate phosphatase family protein